MSQKSGVVQASLVRVQRNNWETVGFDRIMTKTIFTTVSLAALMCAGTSLSAQATDSAPATAQAPAGFEQFQPKQNRVRTKIDYTIWDEALSALVVRMGKSIREGAPRPTANVGTRRIYGHDSRLRLEGNRVGFSFFSDEITQSIVDYRKDLEDTANAVDISTLSKNEQLAFWMNLHNVAIIEQIAVEYPLSQPSKMKIGDTGLPLDEAPFITVRGVKMSPKDIRTKIVYPNWKDPKVIYGFFRGDIGGPSIQREAYSATNLNQLLDRSAKEFINSLRGTEKSGKTMKVSDIFAEAQPFFFRNWTTDLRNHYSKYAEEDVQEIMAKTTDVEAALYETDIADLSNGERDPEYAYKSPDPGQGKRAIGIPAAIQRLMVERQQKIDKIIKRGDRQGTVTFVDIDLDGDGEPVEVE